MKKFVTLLAVITAILALSVIGVNAAAGYVDDFSEPPAEGKIESYTNWNYYSANSKDGATWEDGMVRMERLESNGLIWNMKTNLTESDGFTMMDVKLNEAAASNGVGGYYYSGTGERVAPSGFSGLEPNVWYKVIMMSKKAEDGKVYYSMFAKKEGTDMWVKRSGPNEMSASTEGSHFRINWSNKDGKDIGCVMYIDNVEAHEGLYWEKMMFTDDQGTEISAEDKIPEAATALTFTADIYNAKTIDTDMVSNPQLLSTVPILVAYDKNGMMLDCGISEYGIDYFRNTLSVTVELGDYDKSKIKSVKFYLWDSVEGMLNVMDPIEFR